MTRLGVVSDIHGNLPALEAVLDDMEPVDSIVCLGDIVGILGFNSDTVSMVRDQCDEVVFGNHDARIRPDFAFSPSWPSAQDEMRVVTEQLDSDAIEWLSNLPDRVETPSYILAHARPVYQRDPGYPYHGFAQGDYGVPPKDATRLGPHLDGKMALLGHTHEQHGVDCSKFPGQSGAVVNPGSVGVPWYKDARYAVVDTETQEFDLHRVEYDTSRVEAQLEAQGTPAGKYSESNRLYNATS